ncbi:DedA family protein [Patescibacteria group bacterium]|jgi:membrane-associated protein|nr:DedA family protein [Patescibacteria group bacterium]
MFQIISFFIHLDRHLSQIVASAGMWSYGILLAIIFCETGLIVTPFLPGDSLLFAAGSIAALGALNLPTLLIVLLVAAIAGDAFNYWIAREMGLKLLEGPLSGYVNQKHLEKTTRFYEKYGAKAIVLARFVPIMRTIAPFTAGIARMDYRRFALYNVVGAVLWVSIFTLGGYVFGNIPVVKKNFSLVILGIIIVSLLPALVEWWRARKASAKVVETP